MEQVEFFKLSRAIQDRFLESARGTGVPAPLLYARSFPWPAVGWLAAAGAIGFLFVSMLGRGYGSLESNQAIGSFGFLVVLGGLAAACFVCLLLAVLAWRAPRMLPYVPARYLFPIGVLDATRPRFRLFTVKELQKVEASGSSVRLVFQGGQEFTFSAAKPEHAKAVVESMREVQGRLPQIEAEMNRRDLALLDPLRDTGFSNPFSPKTSRVLPNLRSARLAGIPICVLLGLLLGWQSFQVRNAYSERALFDAARQLNTPDAYRKYLERGGQRKEVETVLLPRAELVEAQRKRSVEAIEKFIAEHPNSAIQAEATAALRQALLNELGASEAKGTISALRAFGTRYPRHELVKADYDKAIEKAYKKAFERYRKAIAPSDERVVAFVERLLDFARRHGSKVELRFRRVIRESLTKNDPQIKRDGYSSGVPSLPGQYFEEAYAKPREEKAGALLIAEWQRAFPKDVVEFSMGPPLNGQEGPLPDVKVPTLFVEHFVSGAGFYRVPNPRGVFVGVGLVYNAVFAIPGQEERLTFRSSLWRTPDPAVLKREGAQIADVYEDMANDGFNRFIKQYTAKHFQKSN